MAWCRGVRAGRGGLPGHRRRRCREVAVLHRTGTVTSGIVVGETTSTTRSGLPLRHPVVRFTLPGGQQVQALFCVMGVVMLAVAGLVAAVTSSATRPL